MNAYHGNITGMDVQEQKTSTRKSPYQRYAQAPTETLRQVRTGTLKEKPAIETIKKPEPQKGLTPLKMFFGFLLFASLMILWIWESSRVRQGLIEVEKLKDQKLEIEKLNESIQAEITKMSGVERIQKIAKEQLKMVPSTEKPGVIFIENEKKSESPK